VTEYPIGCSCRFPIHEACWEKWDIFECPICHSRIEEEEEFRRLAKSPNIYDLVSKSIAPSIYGFHDIKKAIACLLFGDL
jgi:DNA replicative helicase MCM subunit Mcm2 (Cdc46/Mcm family)